MFTKRFWQDTAERVIATAAAVGAVSVPVTAATSMDWRTALVMTGLTALATLLKCLAATRKGDPASASLVK